MVIAINVVLYLFKAGGESMCEVDPAAICKEGDSARLVLFGIFAGAVGVLNALLGSVYASCCKSQEPTRHCFAFFDIITASLLLGNGVVSRPAHMFHREINHNSDSLLQASAVQLSRGHNSPIRMWLLVQVFPGFFGCLAGLGEFVMMGKDKSDSGSCCRGF